VKDDAPARRVGGGSGGCQLAFSCSQRCHYCAPKPPPRPAAATRPGDAGVGSRRARGAARRHSPASARKRRQAKVTAAPAGQGRWGGERGEKNRPMVGSGNQWSSRAPGFSHPTPSNRLLPPLSNPPSGRDGRVRVTASAGGQFDTIAKPRKSIFQAIPRRAHMLAKRSRFPELSTHQVWVLLITIRQNGVCNTSISPRVHFRPLQIF
jgi:hypothetical protein